MAELSSHYVRTMREHGGDFEAVLEERFDATAADVVVSENDGSHGVWAGFGARPVTLCTK